MLANKIIFLMQNKIRLLEMENESKKMGKPNAAKEIVEYCYKLIKEGVKGTRGQGISLEPTKP